jgi:aryl-alcohol dehydrogenase (NADP+)
VWIYNYFYRDTIEDRIYQALEDRIQWFEDVVGDLQPILAEVGEVTRKLAMLPADQQEAEFEREIARLREQIDEARLQALKLDEYQEARQPDGRLCSPVTLADLQAVLTQSDATRHLFQPHPELADAWMLSLDGTSAAVTFSREQFDAHPDTLQFLSYGNPLFHALLDSVPEPGAIEGCAARFDDMEGMPVREWYDLTASAPTPIPTLGDLRRVLACAAPACSPNDAEALFQDQVTAVRSAYQSRSAEFVAMQRSTLQAKARRLLVKAGKARYIGASSMYAWQFATAQHAAERHGWTRFVAMQNHYNLVYREEEREMNPLCVAQGVGLIPWSPLARGFLAGNRARGGDAPTTRAQTDDFAQQMYYQEADFAVVDRVVELAERRGVKPAQIALAWLLAQPGVTSPIIGASKMHQREEAVAALEIELSVEERAYLEQPYVPHPILGHS